MVSIVYDLTMPGFRKNVAKEIHLKPREIKSLNSAHLSGNWEWWEGTEFAK